MIKRYFGVAILYYFAIFIIIILFQEQSYSGNLFQNILSHFVFLNPYSATPYTFISPAWFLTPLIAFYILFPLLKITLKKHPQTLLVLFALTTFFRTANPVYTSPNPLFYLAEFCFGIYLFQNKKSLLLLSPLLLLINILDCRMILPFIIVYLIYSLENYTKQIKLIQFISTQTLAIFLFHEAFMKIIYNEWAIYNLNKYLSIISLGILTTLAIIFSKKINSKIAKKL